LCRTGRRPLSHPNHSTTHRLPHLNENSLQHEKRQFGCTAQYVIHILCKTDLLDILTERGYTASATDYLGYLIGKPGSTGVDTWGNLNSSEWGYRRLGNQRGKDPKGNQNLPHTKLHSIYVGYGAIHSKTQAHELVNILCDLAPTLQKLHMPGTTTEIGLRAAKSLAIRGLALRDSIQLVTWLHGLPFTGAREFLTLIRDSPRATVLHILEGCEQIALLNLFTQGYLPDKPFQEFGGHPIGKQLVPFVLVFERELFPRLTYMQNLITHIQKCSAHIPRTTTNTITYEPLADNGDGRLPPQRPFSTHPNFRPTVKRRLFDDPYAHLPGEQSCKDLEYDDLVDVIWI